MNNSQTQLTSVLRAAQMGQIGIRSVLDKAAYPPLQQALRAQLLEYDGIEQEARSLASRRGWELKDLNPVIRHMCGLTVRMRLRRKNAQSQIAGMMIQGNTRGMIVSAKNLHRFRQPDLPVQALSQKLLDTENANIRQMKPFL